MENNTSISPVSPNLLHVARHESGHAGLASLLHLDLDTASIHPTEGARGHVQLSRKITDISLPSLPPEQRTDLGNRLLLVALGGAAALTVLEGNACWEEAQEDMAVYHDTLTQMEVSLEQQDQLFFRLLAQACKMILANQDEIENMAQILVQKKVLNGSEVRKLMALSPPTKNQK